MWFTLSRSLFVLGLFVSTALIIAIAVTAFALSTVRIKGPEYARIIEAKDLIADIMPPPIFVVEAYLLATEAALNPDLAAANIGEIRKLQQNYKIRLDFWLGRDLDATTRQVLEAEVKSKGQDFWQVMDDVLIPALDSGDYGQRRAALDNLRPYFLAEKAAVEDLVQAASRSLESVESRARQTMLSYSLLAATSAAGAILALVGGLAVFRRRAIYPLQDLARSMKSLAEGDFETSIPHTARHDEVGEMAQAVGVFRQAGLENRRLEQEVALRREEADAEKTQRLAEQTEQAANLQRVIDELGAGLQRLSQFNIRETLDQPFREEFEQLRHDFNKSLAVFQGTMSRVLEKASEIEANSTALQQSTDQLARRTEQQAAAVEESAVALKEVAANIKTSSTRTRNTRTMTREARQRVERSSRVVGEAVEAMRRIEAASASIAKITDVIDQIAFQTNLLALNAGVEAARAGEAGKGFAVVTQEVRDLAQRSGTAAKEINGLISQSVREVADGVALVNDTGSVLGDIEKSIISISEDVEAIAIAAEEQASGIAEISEAVNQMDQLTQQNAGMVQETTAATHTLSNEVRELVRLVSQFVFNRRQRVRDRPEDVAETLARRGRLAGRVVEAA
ncbi:methyl-accepting chemotaxis protein [Peteryoungia desertarenae]|uniref:Methyl-accepting chemotaxis protein n=1 Tax=Peteryoungia desertarenae TaxID=1813451 RepID=A0ABX6QR13_9HYPH|nr:methyl-accepting chemotaxis protein [Peteryoungia desertarenae]QLF71044.1 methyl-accepting chemotaxis protein [Peteryoungia desertarenae]